MDRRDFIKHTGTATAALAIGGVATAAQAGSPPSPVASPSIISGSRDLRLAMPWPQNGRGFDDSARRLAQSVQTLSGGRYRISIAPAAATLDVLGCGQADLYLASGHDFVALDRTFAYFAGLPGTAGLRPTYLNAWLVAAGGQELWDGLAEPHGFKPILTGHSGARAKLWSREAIANSNDLRGRRIAASGLAVDLVRSLGAEPVAVAPAALADALSNGHIDAVEWGGAISGFACDVHLGARHCLRPGLSRSGFTTVLAVKANVWAEMPDTDKAIFQAAAAQELNTVVAESLSVSRNLRLALGQQHDISFGALPVDIADTATRAAADIVAQLSRQNDQAARIHSSYAAFRAGLPGLRKRPSQAPMA